MTFPPAFISFHLKSYSSPPLQPPSLSSHTMKTLSFPWPYIILIILTTSQFSCCTGGRRIAADEAEKKWGAELPVSSPWNFTIPPLPDHGNDAIDPRYGVSKRLVPEGPNPLHNR
ncbi:hypothetical protein MRB53_032569 [Persea americana]|uniref:Uncharacterized protein n=1 Tax=Persea americana TaxID=3435 RepID=A0ACC2KS58_PERAE|nr:hypothetical protein MRB53_032569 [Persea americana]|eukprot:TRINITY_DN47952_c0_g1_i1.p1 TRINITY_DN47952_c0_g1~~TRINITY_DN47952_c0_g1_i1.p1  ORF type:complete len:115 (-),score=17.05 TRINITY_DN47952_c0_g1_i1:67-411(-)